MTQAIRDFVRNHSLTYVACAAFCCTLLSACGGGGGGGGGGGNTGYTVGGSIAGLLDAGLVLSDGTASVSPAAGATSFTFANNYSAGAGYSVTISAQPPGLACTIVHGTGTVQSSAVTSVSVVCPTPWVFQGGKNTSAAAGVYGTQGTAAAGNLPGGRSGAVTWTDDAGNLWLFGGLGYDSTDTQGYLNDLWRYSPASGSWTWVSGSNVNGATGVYGAEGVGSTSNTPGARQGAVSWTDASGNFWLFGGYQTLTGNEAGGYNDLWEYVPTSGQWTWVSGSSTVNAAGVYGTLGVAAASNVPPARAGASSWLDAAGDLWLFGGSTFTQTSSASLGLADLWKYSPTTKLWTWVAGTQTLNAPGVYGSLGTPAPTNEPGARDSASSWVDASGALWLFGGLGFDSTAANGTPNNLNDLWKFDPALGTQGEWTWVSGSDLAGAKGVYGTLGAAAAGNVPGARDGAASWIDLAGNLWLFGGSGYDSLGNGGALNDVWEFSPTTAQWTWVTGFEVQGANGSYGAIGASGAYSPGSRAGSAGWTVGSKFWLFGGIGYNSISTNPADLSDLWQYSF
jgi:N-acetylneuraminic acid mutarotase